MQLCVGHVFLFFPRRAVSWRFFGIVPRDHFEHKHAQLQSYLANWGCFGYHVLKPLGLKDLGSYPWPKGVVQSRSVGRCWPFGCPSGPAVNVPKGKSLPSRSIASEGPFALHTICPTMEAERGWWKTTVSERAFICPDCRRSLLSWTNWEGWCLPTSPKVMVLQHAGCNSMQYEPRNFAGLRQKG